MKDSIPDFFNRSAEGPYSECRGSGIPQQCYYRSGLDGIGFHNFFNFSPGGGIWRKLKKKMGHKNDNRQRALGFCAKKNYFN
jgi:hypothetical protein